LSSRGISSWAAAFLLISSAFVGGTLVYISYWHTLNIEQETLKRSAQSYSRAIESFRTFYSQQILERLHGTGVEVTHDYKDRENAIPIPATMTLELAKVLNRAEPRQSISIVSKYPFPWREQRNLSAFEDRAIDEFTKTPSSEYSELQNIAGEQYLYYATPMRMSAGCVECHNSHPDSPKTDWQIGDVRGLQIVQLPVGEITGENRLGLAYLITFILFSFICAFSVILWLVGRNQLAFAELNANAKVMKRTNVELKSLKDAIDKHAIVSIADRDGAITDANDLFCDISGYSKAELIGKNHRIIRSGDHPAAFFTNMWSTIQSGQVWKGQIKNRSKNGDYYWVNSTIVPYLDENKEPFQYIAIRTDISAIKKLEEETERNRRFLASITDALGEGVIAVDAAGNCTFANPEALRLLGRGDVQLIGQSMRDIIPDACHGQILDSPTETYRSENLALQRMDGPDFDAAVIAVPMFEDGSFAGSVIAFQDISDRKTAEKALKLSEERFRQVASTAQEAIITADQDGRIIFWNNAAIRTFGYEVDEILNKPLSVIVPHALREGHRKGFKNAIESGELVHQGKTLELPALRKDGAEIITEVVLSTWIADGKRYFTAMARDITERKQLMVDLADATRQAEAANQAKSDFLANMSHEIRTPMNAIIGLSHLALQTDLTPKQLDYLEKIQNASKLLLGIINDILDISKIEAGQMEIETIPFNLMDVLDGVIAVTAHKAVEKNIEFLIDISANVAPDLMGDPLRLGQILNNLVSNAVKFTTNGEVLLSVYQELREDDLHDTVFEIRDTGVGMSADQMKKLFRPLPRPMSRQPGDLAAQAWDWPFPSA
jgi:PAS domain S-box-containing protein